MKLIRRIVISLSLTLLAGGVGALLLFGLPFTGWKALTVPTGSMRPTIPSGSLVLMHRVPTSSLKIGDVITYTNLAKPGTTITHRIVRSYKINGIVPAFVTKGDSNPIADQPIVGGLVLGKTIWHLSHVGSWINFIKNPYVLLPMVYIPALAIVIEEIKRLNAYYKSQMPYVLAGYERAREARSRVFKMGTALKLSAAIVVVMGVVAVPAVQAILRSNTVALAPNRLTVAKIIPPPTCNTNGTNITITGNSGGNNNVNVTNTTNQTSTTGNASSSNGGTATSGNATNTNCTNINVTITNGH